MLDWVLNTPLLVNANYFQTTVAIQDMKTKTPG